MFIFVIIMLFLGAISVYSGQDGGLIFSLRDGDGQAGNNTHHLICMALYSVLHLDIPRRGNRNACGCRPVGDGAPHFAADAMFL